MANECFCQIDVRGTESAVRSFVADVKTLHAPFSLATLKAMNSELSNLEAWGTSEDAICLTVEEVTHDPINYKVIITFSTAWTPPLKWMHAAAVRYPQVLLVLRYEETGRGFSGWGKYQHNNWVEVQFNDFLPLSQKLLGFSGKVVVDNHINVTSSLDFYGKKSTSSV